MAHDSTSHLLCTMSLNVLSKFVYQKFSICTRPFYFRNLKLMDSFCCSFHLFTPQLREEHKQRGIICGTTLPNPLTTEANVLFVKFVSDSTFSGRGFEAAYVQAEGYLLISRKHVRVI